MSNDAYLRGKSNPMTMHTLIHFVLFYSSFWEKDEYINLHAKCALNKISSSYFVQNQNSTLRKRAIYILYNELRIYCEENVKDSKMNEI